MAAAAAATVALATGAVLLFRTRPEPALRALEVGTACGTDSAPPRLRRARVAADGSCLYHALAEGLHHRRIGDTAWPAGPAWQPGPRAGERAGNMRRVLLSYVDALEADGADLGAYLMPGDTPAALRARVEARCQLGTGTCGWAEYGEVALLASLFGVCVTVFLASEGYEPSGAVGATARGAMDTGDTAREFRAGCESGRAKLMVLNVDSTHFDALLPCAA